MIGLRGLHVVALSGALLAIPEVARADIYVGPGMLSPLQDNWGSFVAFAFVVLAALVAGVAILRDVSRQSRSQDSRADV